MNDPRSDSRSTMTATLFRRLPVFSAVLTLLLIVFSLSYSRAQDLNDFVDPLNLGRSGRGRMNQAAEVEVKTSLTPKNPLAGEIVTLSIEMKLPKVGYTYSMNQAFGGGTEVKFEAEEGVEAQGEFTADHPPEVVFVPEFKQDVEKYKKSVTWTRKYQIKSDAKTIRLKGVLKYQFCDDSNCTNKKHAFDEQLTLASPEPVPAKATGSGTAGVDPRFVLDYAPKHKHTSARLQFAPVDPSQPDVFALQLKVQLEPGWHTFSITQPEGQSAAPTSLIVDNVTGLVALDESFTPDRAPHIVKAGEKGQYTHEQFEDHVTWTRRYQLAPNTLLNDVQIGGEFQYQVCKESCIPGKAVAFEFPLKGTAEAISVRSTPVPAPPGSVTNQTDSQLPGSKLVPEPASATTAANKKITAQGITDLSGMDCVAGDTRGGDIRDQGFLAVMSSAFLFGLLALLTPCVFPMVPITVSFFLKESEKKHSSPVKLALVYCLSIIATFTVLGLLFSAVFGASSINTLANGVALNLFLGIVLLFFALNLLGMFDIQIPSWLLTFTASKESTGSYLGVFFMALTFTLTSFTCTFAFLGLILVWAANGQFWWPLMGLISFSTAFALPFFFLALFPSVLRKLPKSGGWMNRVKVVMGLIEMAFMFKFLSVADISWNSTPTYLDYHTVMTAWIVIALFASLYLMGKIRLAHDTVEEHSGVLPILFSMGFLGLALYLAAGIFSPEPPSGVLGQQIAAFAPPRFKGGSGEEGPYLIGEHDSLKYLLDIDRAKVMAASENRPLFLDFTGMNCLNCRKMENKMSAEAIQTHLKAMVRVQLYTDRLPKVAINDAETSKKLLEQNNKLAAEWYGEVSLPSYAVVTPDGKTILSRISGDVDPEIFAAFLKCGIGKWDSLKKGGKALAAVTPAAK